jgi:Zn finger protein HypA/HybF involved in hydrogenase expression
VKRKRTPVVADPMVPETVVPEAIIEQARRALEIERIKKPAHCVVCGSECAPNSTEGLCWVCRRLKLSAWRDSDSQASAQE